MTAKKVRAPKARLIAVDGVDAAAVLAEARAALATPERGGISRWDASGVFQELAVADDSAGAPSARTLLLLYAADLAFRLRWQIRPALAEGRTVVAAPYVETAIAFGRAAGLNPAWLSNLFRFAPPARTRRFVHPQRGRRRIVKDGFVGFSCERLSSGHARSARRRIIDETAAHLRRRDR
jgi:thymidylate kinase